MTRLAFRVVVAREDYDALPVESLHASAITDVRDALESAGFAGQVESVVPVPLHEIDPEDALRESLASMRAALARAKMLIAGLGLGTLDKDARAELGKLVLMLDREAMP